MKKNKIISAVTAAAIAITAFSGIFPNAVPDMEESIGVSAADTKSGECGRKVTWTLDKEGTLTVSGTGDMYDYPGYAERPEYSEYISLDRIENVVIKKGVTHIGSNAFSGIKALNKITIPDGVKSIGNSAFSGCGLTDITLGKDLESIGGYAFAKNPVTSIIIPDSVTTVGNCAFRATGLTM